MIYLICLNWDTTDMLIRMYESAVSLAEKPFNLIIVDNGSQKNEYERLIKYDFKNCTIIRNEKNLGFAAGNNKALNALQIVNDSIVVFINSDIIIKEKHWDLKFKSMLSQENVGIVGCAYHPLKWSKTGHVHPQTTVTQMCESEGVQGAFFGVKKTNLDKILNRDGCYFDESFKMAQYEEIDLQWRVGLKCIYFMLDHIHDHNHSSTKAHGYKLCDKIQNISQFKENTEKNRKLLMIKHSKFFSSKQ